LLVGIAVAAAEHRKPFFFGLIILSALKVDIGLLPGVLIGFRRRLRFRRRFLPGRRRFISNRHLVPFVLALAAFQLAAFLGNGAVGNVEPGLAFWTDDSHR
jgi:hypothetical protein